LFGAGDLHRQGKKEFSEWDLSVATWKRNPNRFGCRGYEDVYPDHKRVMMEIMSLAKKDNPIRRGLLAKTRPNYYSVTDLGLAEINELSAAKDTGEKSRKSPQPIYDAVYPFYEQAVFRKYMKDPDEPRMWLGAAAFLGLENNEPIHVQDRRKIARSAISGALKYLDETKADSFHRGVTSGGEALSRESILKLKEFLDVIEKRFAQQFEAISRQEK
jgi:hypothetical protein